MEILKSNADIKKFLSQGSTGESLTDSSKLEEIYDQTINKHDYSNLDSRVRTIYVESSNRPSKFKTIVKDLKIALIVGAIACFGYSKKDYLMDYIRFMHIVEDNNVSMEQIEDAVNGMVPERNQNINEYNEALDELCKTDLDTSVKVDDASKNLEIAYEEKNKTIGDEVADVLTKDTPDETEDKYMSNLVDTLALVKTYTTEPTESDPNKSIGDSIRDGWTGFLSLFGGRTVEETHESDVTSILRKYTDFIFSNSEVDGELFENLSYEHQVDTIEFDLYTYRALERRFPGFRSSLDEDTIYPTLEARLTVFEEYLTQTEKLDQNYLLIKDYLATANYGSDLGLQKTK